MFLAGHFKIQMSETPRTRIDQRELDAIVEAHEAYLKAPGRSDPAKLSFFDLSGLRFNGHNLSQADFAGSSLEFATFADLS